MVFLGPRTTTEGRTTPRRGLSCYRTITKIFRQPLPGGLFPAGGGAHGHGSEAEMKAMIFPVNIDKFTGFFDKFPEIYRNGRKEIFRFYSAGYRDNIKRKMNDLSKFTG